MFVYSSKKYEHGGFGREGKIQYHTGGRLPSAKGASTVGWQSIYVSDCTQLAAKPLVQNKRLSWFGHLNRLPDKAPAKVAFREPYFRPPKKIRGGQPLNWLHTIKKDFKVVNLTIEQAIKITKDRQEYNGILDCVMAKSLNVVHWKGRKGTDKAGKALRRRRREPPYVE